MGFFFFFPFYSYDPVPSKHKNIFCLLKNEHNNDVLIGLDLKATLWQVTKTSLELLFRYILCNKYDNYCSKVYNQCSVHCTYILIYCQALNIRFCKATLNPKNNPQNMLTNALSHRNSASGYYPMRSSSSYSHISWKTKSQFLKQLG